MSDHERGVIERGTASVYAAYVQDRGGDDVTIVVEHGVAKRTARKITLDRWMTGFGVSVFPLNHVFDLTPVAAVATLRAKTERKRDLAAANMARHVEHLTIIDEWEF